MERWHGRPPTRHPVGTVENKKGVLIKKLCDPFTPRKNPMNMPLLKSY